MTGALVTTCAFAAAALAVLFLCSLLATRNFLLAPLVVLPLALKIPWAKPYPAVGEAVSLLAVAVVLLALLSARTDTPLARRRAFAVLALAVALKPEILLLALATLAVESTRRRRRVPLSLAAKGAALLILVAVVSIVLKRFALPPSAAIAGLYGRVRGGFAWDSQSWMFAGGGALRLHRLAKTYSPHFWWPLLPPVVVMAFRQRQQWWLAPAAAWATLVCLLTLVQVPDSNFHGCLPMQAALVVFSALLGISELRGIAPPPGAKADPPAVSGGRL